ncbi:GGDEF domain-containing protein [Pectinatus sottacetonis]|uniref:GGDEF domain-containing protein n=1 Tax=Pectinatus sottacetonis TaxID=1002795 RepID=UPI0018C72E6B|nr:GGDEF domain-containing protein [Pectinatus sottacetonis]
MDSGRKIINSNRQIVINSIITDISPLKNALERLKIEQNINDILFDLSDEIIFQYDAIKNTAILKLKNKNNSNIHKKFSLLSTKKLERYGIVDESIQKIEHYIIKLKNKLFLHRPIFDFTLHQIYNNKHIWWRVKGIGILNSEHKTVRMIGKLTDITNNVCLEEKSSHDSLTGLYNRDYLINYIKENINIKNDVKNCYYTLVLFDIDHFKTINDLLGHPTGDKALCLIADVLSAKCSCDMIAARIGGDEFAIFVPHIDARDKLKCILVEIIDNIREEGWNNHISLNLSISIGVSSLYSYSKDVSFKKLYKEADIALYKAKNSGRSRYVFYEYDETKTTL